jgi:hypothetical protein
MFMNFPICLEHWEFFHISPGDLNPVYTFPTHFFNIRSKLSSRLRLGLPSGLFPSGFPTKLSYIFQFRFEIGVMLDKQIEHRVSVSSLMENGWVVSEENHAHRKLACRHDFTILQFFHSSCANNTLKLRSVWIAFRIWRLQLCINNVLYLYSISNGVLSEWILLELDFAAFSCKYVVVAVVHIKSTFEFVAYNFRVSHRRHICDCWLINRVST